MKTNSCSVVWAEIFNTILSIRCSHQDVFLMEIRRCNCSASAEVLSLCYWQENRKLDITICSQSFRNVPAWHLFWKEAAAARGMCMLTWLLYSTGGSPASHCLISAPSNAISRALACSFLSWVWHSENSGNDALGENNGIVCEEHNVIQANSHIKAIGRHLLKARPELKTYSSITQLRQLLKYIYMRPVPRLNMEQLNRAAQTSSESLKLWLCIKGEKRRSKVSVKRIVRLHYG